MILKGSQRAGGTNLAVHLMRSDENEHVEVHEIRGFASSSVRGAFQEAEAISLATKCRQYLFSLSLSPPESAQVPISVFEAAIDRIEQKLGLEDQPRVIVFHEKEGRRHCHCVWSRIDGDTLTARPLPYFKNRLTEISRDLYLENEWKMPKGLMRSQARSPANFTLAEWQQAKRRGVDPRWTKDVLAECWAVSDSKAAFERCLQERGYVLARGDRRGFVAVDYQGEIHSLSRALALKTKQLAAKLGDHDALPDTSQARVSIAQLLTPAIRQHIGEARMAFAARTASLNHNKAVMRDRHTAARMEQHRAHEIRAHVETRQRLDRLPKGLRWLWAKVTGGYARLCKENEANSVACALRDRAEREALVARQLSERRELQLQIKSSRRAQASLLKELRFDLRRHAVDRANDLSQRRIERRSYNLN